MKEAVKNVLLEKGLIDDNGKLKKLPDDLYIDSSGTVRLKSEKTKGFAKLKDLIMSSQWSF